MADRVLPGVDRRDFLRLVGVAGAAGAFATSLSACGGPASTTGSGVPADTIEAGISYSLSGGFDPMIASGAVATAANMHTFEALVDLDPVTREPYAALASDMPEKVDDTTYRVTLREGATFHDGSPVTVEDVVFSFERILEPANHSLMVQFLPFLDGVEALDGNTVEFGLKYNFPLFAERLAVAKIVPRKIVEADPDGFGTNPVGSGPFKQIEATRGDKVVFEKWADYNGPRPARVTNMIWRLTSDPSARVSAMVSGRVLAIESVPYIDVERVERTATVESIQSFGLLFLMFHCGKPPFDDKRVRQALHYAVDIDEVISTAMLGNATAASSFLQPTHPEYRKAKTVYSHDPEKAKRLLAEAGVPNPSLTLLATDTGWVKDVAPLIKQSWDAVGVRTTLDISKSAAQYSRVDSGRYEAMIAPGDPSVFGNDVDLLISWWYGGNTWPHTRMYWADTPGYARIRSLLDRAARTDDDARRSALWYEAINVIADEAPLYPLLHRKLPTGWKNEALANFRPIPTTGLSFLDVGRA